MVSFAVARPAASQEGCRAWTGELSPLPNTRSSDAFAARWASLRASELARLAEALEDTQPATAYHLWRHVECLDPERSGAAQRADALRTTVSYRDRPFVILPKPPREARRVFSFTPIDRKLEDAEAQLSSARFQRAIEVAEEVRGDLEARFVSGALASRLTRLETIAATAWIALGDQTSASMCFARALAADATFELDPAMTPPKVLRVLAEVRERSGLEREADDEAPQLDEIAP